MLDSPVQTRSMVSPQEEEVLYQLDYKSIAYKQENQQVHQRSHHTSDQPRWFYIDIYQ